MRATLSILGLSLSLAACNGNTAAAVDAGDRCMHLCTRANTVCGASRDCVQFCDVQSPVYIACDPQIDTFQDCVEDNTDANLCGASGTCNGAFTAVDTCIAAHSPTDAGATPDAGATTDAGTDTGP